MTFYKTKYLRALTLCACLAGESIMTSCDSGGVNLEAEKASDYMIAQTEKGGHWCIVNANENVVADRIFPPEAQLSRVYAGDCFWVKAYGKLKLYSVNSPSTPVTTTAYDSATDFCDGLAFTSVRGKPLQMIDTQGKVRATLGKDVTNVSSFHNGRARFRQKTAEGELLYGYLNEQGKIAIPATYESAGDFYDGVAVVRINSESDCFIIDTNGTVVGKLNRQEGLFYDIGLADYYTLTSILIEHGKNQTAVNVRTRPKDIAQGGVIELGNGFMAIRCGGGYGAADAKGKIVIPPVYDGCMPFMVGDNFVFQTDSVFFLVGKDGKGDGKKTYSNIGNMRLEEARTMR